MSQILAVALSNGRSVRELQSEAKDSMADLVKTVAQLSDTTHIELDRINGSAYLIQQYLEIQRYQSIWPWKNWLIKAFGFIYSGNYEVFDRWVSLWNILNLFLVDPGSLGLGEKAILFRVLLSVAGFICAVFRMAIPFSAVRFLSFKPDWSAQCCLFTECCSGTLRYHTKICHSEIDCGPFFCEEWVSLAKISDKFNSYIALHSKCSAVDIPNVDCKSLREESVSYQDRRRPSRPWGNSNWVSATGLSNPW